MLRIMAEERGGSLCATHEAYCIDNGAMIAYAGYLKYAANQLCDLEGEVRARWPLSET